MKLFSDFNAPSHLYWRSFIEFISGFGLCLTKKMSLILNIIMGSLNIIYKKASGITVGLNSKLLEIYLCPYSSLCYVSICMYYFLLEYANLKCSKKKKKKRSRLNFLWLTSASPLRTPRWEKMLLSVAPRTGINPYNGYNSRNSKKVTQTGSSLYLAAAFQNQWLSMHKYELRCPWRINCSLLRDHCLETARLKHGSGSAGVCWEWRLS